MLIRDTLDPLGYVHRRDLLDAGWRPDRIRAAVLSEDLVVVRRQWILEPTAHPALILAATHGGRVACRTAGELRGAWSLDDDPRIHLRMTPHQSDVASAAVVHRSLDLVPASPRSLVEPLLNALGQVAACVPRDGATMIWESALNRGLITPSEMRATQWRGQRARDLAVDCVTQSDSGLETRFVGGMAREGIRVRQQVILLGRPVDGLVGERLVTQLDGWRFHNDARQRRADIAHDRALTLAGYHVLRFDYHQVMHRWPDVVHEVRQCIAQGLHRIH